MQTTTTAEQDAQVRERAQQAEQQEQQRRQEATQEYETQKERRAALTELTLKVTENQAPTPTQEENDKAKLGILHPDEKADPNNPEMPPLHVQQAYLEGGEGRLEPVTRQPPGRPRPGQPATPQPPRRPNEPPPPAQRPAERDAPRGERP
jgi:hypothetical protein